MKDLTQGSIPRHLLTMAAPMIIGMLVQTLYYLVDLYYVSKLGDAAVAGVGAAATYALAGFPLGGEGPGQRGLFLGEAELNAQANRLAHRLIELGVGPDVLVGVCAERSVEMLVGLLAVLKAGGAYVPLDPAYPPARLALMLGTVLCGVGFAGFGFVNSIFFFYAVCWLFGLGYAGMALVPNTSLMTRWLGVRWQVQKDLESGDRR